MPVKTTSQTKLLLAGTWKHSIYEQACADALNKLGVKVIPLEWGSNFPGIIGRLEERYVVPYKNTTRLNNKLLQTIHLEKPDIVFIWRGTHIYPQTINAIRKSAKAKIISYNNDSPFRPLYKNSKSLHERRMWKMYMNAILKLDTESGY